MVVHYAFVVNNWINGADLKDHITFEIEGLERYRRGINPNYHIEEHKVEINKCISIVLDEIDRIIGFKLCRYFQQFSLTYEFCHRVKSTPGWHEF